MGSSNNRHVVRRVLPAYRQNVLGREATIIEQCKAFSKLGLRKPNSELTRAQISNGGFRDVMSDLHHCGLARTPIERSPSLDNTAITTAYVLVCEFRCIRRNCDMNMQHLPVER